MISFYTKLVGLCLSVSSSCSECSGQTFTCFDNNFKSFFDSPRKRLSGLFLVTFFYFLDYQYILSQNEKKERKENELMKENV